MAVFMATTDSAVSEREKRNLDFCRKIAAEGMVLLENNGVLPMELKGKRIALFGNGARHTVPGGTGSGEVNARTITTVEQGLEHAGAVITTKAWLAKYEKAASHAKAAFMEKMKAKYADSPEMAFWAMFSYRNPLTIAIDDADLADTGDTAVYVLSRNSGEGSDRRNTDGDYKLHRDEVNTLSLLSRHYQHLIVVLNIGGVIDTTFLRGQTGIDALLLMGQAGAAGGDALADILGGKVTPCGHLAATWAEDYGDYPNADNYGHRNGNIDDEYYTEGIYVGYRWFDSFGKTPAYPFGYGKSYTSFDVNVLKADIEDDRIAVLVRVTNAGSRYAGKEVVQVYTSSPAGKLDKPYQELAAYAKTRKLLPGESEELTLTFPVSSMASYDEVRAAWILEKGDYLIRVGTHSRATKVSGIVRLEEDMVCRKLANVLALDCEMESICPDRKLFYTYPSEAEETAQAPIIIFRQDIAENTGSEELPKKAEEEGKEKSVTKKLLTMDDVISGACTAEELAEQLTAEELTALCLGTARGGQEESSTIGAASASCPGAAGETTSIMCKDRNIRNMILADGPAGLRLSPSYTVDAGGHMVKQEPALGGDVITMLGDGKEVEAPEDAVTHYQYCTAIPIATLLAQTWDLDAVRMAGDIVGSEMEEFGITLWLAPGMNIQRNPLCGRNFEYYSEDPLVSGLCAAADTLGVQSHKGVGTTIKHFACNNQEDNRAYNISHVTERALREIYLRGFEIAVKQAQPLSIMSSYNMINGVHAANSEELLTKIARQEWGFAGIFMTDWGTTASPKPDLEGRMPKYGCASAAACIRAGNDLIMPGSQEDVDEILASVGASEGEVKCPITLGELRACAGRILKVLAKSNAYDRNR